MNFKRSEPLSITQFVEHGNNENDYDEYLEQHEEDQQNQEQAYWDWWDRLSDEEREYYHKTSTEEVGRRLKELRKTKKATQTNVAEFLGVTKQTISNYETGNSTPPNKILDRLAILYDVPVHYILGTEPKRESAVDTEIINTLDYIKSITNEKYRNEIDFLEPEYAPSEKQWLLSELTKLAKFLTTEQLYIVVRDVGLQGLLNINKNDDTDKFRIQ